MIYRNCEWINAHYGEWSDIHVFTPCILAATRAVRWNPDSLPGYPSSTFSGEAKHHSTPMSWWTIGEPNEIQFVKTCFFANFHSFPFFAIDFHRFCHRFPPYFPILLQHRGAKLRSSGTRGAMSRAKRLRSFGPSFAGKILRETKRNHTKLRETGGKSWWLIS